MVQNRTENVQIDHQKMTKMYAKIDTQSIQNTKKIDDKIDQKMTKMSTKKSPG